MVLSDRYNYPPLFHDRSLEALRTALETAPAYAAWASLDPGAGTPLEDRYDSLPELNKQIMRDNFPAGLVPGGRDANEGLQSGQIEYTFTSGTTGERVINIWDQNWWDKAEASAWKLNAHTAGLSYPQREAKLASSLNVGISCEEDLPMQQRIIGNRLYLNEKISLIQWQPRHYERMAAELSAYQPVILEANPSLLARLAFWAADSGTRLYSPAVIVFTFEFISAIHLNAIRKVFSSALISSYGTTETGFVLQECECGMLHQNLDFCRIDFQPLKEEHGGPEIGRMLITTFQNPWNCVLRFDAGDLIRLSPFGNCKCGRDSGLIAQEIEGRAANATFTTGGSLVTTAALDKALARIEGIRDYSLEQTGRAQYELSLMAKGDRQAISKQCAEALNALYGSDGEFAVEIRENLYPGPAGKFRRTSAGFDFDVRGLFV